MSVQQQTGSPRVAGVDWAQDSHVACVIDSDGAVVQRVTVAHDKAGIARLITVLPG